MSSKAQTPIYQHALDRYRFLMILNAANKCGEYQFLKQATMLWLVNYPGDLHVQYYQALTYAHLEKQDQANVLLEGLIEKDPSFIEPLKSLIEFSTNGKKRAYYKNLHQYLTHKNPPENIPENWLSPLYDARHAFSQGDFEKAVTLIHQSLILDPPSPLPAILHLRTARKMANQEMLNNLSEIYYQQWPKCLQVNIIKALAEIDQGEESAAVERLHWVAAQDSAGQVIQQLMGSNHRFSNLWPDRMESYFDLPIPATVSASLGWNRLGSGMVQTPEFKQPMPPQSMHKFSRDEDTQEIRLNIGEKTKDKTVKSSKERETVPVSSADKWASEEDFVEIQKTFTKLAKRLKTEDLNRSDSRFPAYVIMTSKKQLERIYGPNTASVIDELLTDLVSLIQNLPNWGGLLFYPDDPAQMSQIGLKPITGTDAWQIKLALSDLDEALAKHGEMVGALLIVGGPEIIPYHNLPNPTNDNDLDVPSDNPYGTIDENYFIPQWPVGRLPGETGSDAGLLLYQIRNLIYQYQKRTKQAKFNGINFASLFDWLSNLLADLRGVVDHAQNLGYAAEVWREAAAAVYKAAGKTRDLQLSPPIYSGSLRLNKKQGHELGYFNLHGIEDGANWYGQKDFSSTSSGPDYPIALTPKMFNEHIPSPKLVFTEACYGANIIKKRQHEALSLKFLDSGTTSFVGSTCIAYGSVTPPLIAADYLAEKFWQEVLNGQPAGYALMQAKLSLAEEMTRKQGFLDGEDQKTILSFVLLGDPLAVHEGTQAMPKPLFRVNAHPSVRTISDSDMESTDESEKMPKSMDKEVRKVVEKYLPGLQNAQMQYKKSGPEVNQQTSKSSDVNRYVVTLQKSIDQNQHTTHHHYARMTFDKKGKLVKFTTSR